MNVLTKFQLNAIVAANMAAVPYYFPTMQIGQNVPKDLSFCTLPTFSDRTMAILTSGGGQTFYQQTFSNGVISTANQDPTTGLPTTGFSIKYVDGVAQADPQFQGTWCLNYAATVQRTVTFNSGGAGASLVSSTYNSGTHTGQVIFTYNGSGALIVSFDGPVTAPPQCYDPTNSATAIAGSTVAFWNPVYLQTTGAYDYLRFMDVSHANDDYVNTSSSATWPTSVEFSSRCTPSTYPSSTLPGELRGIPLEWMIDLCQETSKPGWFCVPLLYSDAATTAYATMIANSGIKAKFECSGNERWNSAAGFYNFDKTGVAAMAEVILCPSVQLYTNYAQRCVSIASDGVTATVITLNPHGATTGNAVATYGLQSGYTGFAATGTLTVVDDHTVTYPCTQANTGGAVAATTIFGTATNNAGNGIALNAGSNLTTLATTAGAYTLGNAWFFRRGWQQAALIRSAWVAAGRSLTDLETILPLQAGSTYITLNAVQNFLVGIFGAPLSSVFTSACVGGYFTTALNNSSAMNSGFGFSQSVNTPVSSSDVLGQLRTFVDHTYGAYCYGSFATWCGLNGLTMYGYEVGVDTSTVGSQGTAGATVANADPLMEGITRDWLYGLAQFGFKGVGWYQCGAGTYATTGCFNIGQTAAEANYLSGSPSPKMKGIVDARTPPSTLPVTRHAFPCTLSGYDCVGNEPVVTVANAWPSFGQQNLSNTADLASGPNNCSMTYEVWSEIARTATLTMVGHTGGGVGIVVTAQTPSGTTSFTAPAASGSAASGVTLGSCSVQLQQGPNFVQLSVPTASKYNCSPHSIQFS